MTTIRYCKTGLAIAALFAASGAFSATMSKSDYDAAKDRISAELKADKAVCDKYSGNQKDVCQEQAKGKEKVAVAKADAEYAVAKEMCDDKAGNPKDVCVAEAKSAHTKALADAKVAEKVGEVRQDAAQDKRDADYKVAIEKCDGLAGDSKSACVSAAKSRFGKS